MKRLLLILILILAMACSMLCGTLAYYTTAIEPVTGSVTAKEFIFLSEEIETAFQKGIRIAPSETISWDFLVKNHQNDIVTGTDLYYRLTFDISASDNKGAIDPLIVRVVNDEGEELGGITGQGTFAVDGEFLLSDIGQDQKYFVEMYWPESGLADMDYAGDSFGTTIKVSAVARQVPFEGQEPGEQESGIHVAYRTETYLWEQNNYRFYLTIINNSNRHIDDWEITFSLLTDRISKHEPVNYGADYNTPSAGSYRFYRPDYYDQSIPGNGGNISFGGVGIGTGLDPIENVLVNSQSVELTCQLMQ